jgi:hypothetical protein
MKTYRTLGAVLMACALSTAMALAQHTEPTAEYWSTDDLTHFKVTTDGAWYRSVDAGTSWTQLLPPVGVKAISRTNEPTMPTVRNGGWFTLAPNPAADVLRVTLVGATIADVDIQMVDLTGSTLPVKSRLTPTGNSTADITLKGLPRGLWTVVLRHGGNHATTTVIVE